MKLHLSKSLRAAILATFAVLAPLSLSLATATAAGTDSPRPIRWDDNWSEWGGGAYKPGLTELRVREVEVGGCGWNTNGNEFVSYNVTLSVQDPDNPGALPTTREVPACAVAMNGVSDPNSVLPIYNTAAGGYALQAIPQNERIRDYSVFMDISGTFEAVAGGDVYHYNGDWGTENAPSNRFMAIREGAHVGVVSAFNIAKYRESRRTTLLGDSYISVYTNGISDSVVGRTVAEASDCIGDSHVFIYNVLSKNETANIHITENTTTIMWSSKDVILKPGCVVGGSYDSTGVGITGNSWVVVDLQGKDGAATFVKAIAGGSSNTSDHYQTGDAAVFINNAGGISAFSAPVAGQSIYLSASRWTGNSAVVIENSSTNFTSSVVGGNYSELKYRGGADVAMRAGTGTTALTPYLDGMNTSLDNLKAHYTALKDKWEGGGAGDAEPADPAPATRNVTAVRITGSGGASFSRAVVGSNAIYTVDADVINTDTSYVSNKGTVNDAPMYVTSPDADLPGLSGIQSISFTREESSRSIVWIEGGEYQNLVVAGDYLYDTDNVEGAFYNPNPGIRHYIRHYAFRSSIGSTYMHIGGGTFNKQVQGGTYVYAQNYGGRYTEVLGGTPTPQEILVAMRVKDINMELVGGNFGAMKGTAVMGGFDVTDTITAIDKPGQCLTSIVDAEVDSIYIQMGALDANGAPVGTGVTVDGEIIGGSHIKACNNRVAFADSPDPANLRYRYAIRQGSIWVRLLNGTFRGNVYGAGFYDSEGGKYDDLTAPIYTESVNIELSNRAEFGKISISGTYKMSIDDASATPRLSVVNGDRKLSFTSAGQYNNLTKIEFCDFSVVDVTEAAGYVSLSQPLQRLYSGVSANCRKIGEGTLALTNEHSSNVSSFAVEDGTLVLPANSNNYETGLIMSQLTVRENATLDISASSCGTRGRVILEGDSSLKVSSSQAPTRVTAIDWGTDGSEKINIVSNPIPNRTYNVRLFDGLTVDKVSVFGQSLKPLSELGLSEKDMASLLGLDGTQDLGDVYAIRAEGYVNLKSGGKDVSMDNAYLVLRNGVLSLATHIGREITWNGANGDSWNYVDPLFVVGAKAEECYFRDADTVRFVGRPGEIMNVNLDPSDSHAADPVANPPTNNHTLEPYSIIVGADRAEGDNTVPSSNSTVVLGSDDKACKLDVKGSITVKNYSELVVEASAGLATHADSTLVEVDKTSSLAVESDKVGIHTLNNGGSVDVLGSMSVNNRVTSPGSLSVSKDLTLGSDVANAQFGDLEVGGTLNFAEANTATIDGAATIGSAKGGTLVINSGAADAGGVDLLGTSTLKAVQGAGDLTVSGSGSILTLKSPSTIGNLDAEGSVVLYDSLHVDGKLGAKSVTFASVGNGVITDKAVTAKVLDCEPFYMDKGSVKDIHFVCDGDVYTLVEGETVTGALKINDKDESNVSNGRFLYHAYVEGNTIKIGVQNTSPNYYADHATTQNGKTGAASLDSLFRPEIMSRIASNKNAMASVIVAMDNMVEAGNTSGADTLAAAAAGASNAALGCAFSDDVHRQLKAIRNRTTTMGCAESETHEDIPTFNAWINAEGNYHKLDSDGTFAGYTLSSWGGTVGADVDFSEHTTVGLAVSALYGDYSGDGPDTTEGDLDTQYLTLFTRYAARAWVHTFVATVGRADVSVKRTVTAEGVAYSNEGDTDGTGFGFMYEIGRVFAINEDASSCVEPIVNFTLLKSTVGGFTETGTDAVVKTDDLEMTRFIIGAGARMQGVIGATVYNRASILEGRALLKANLGDNSCEAKNSFAIGGIGGTYESAEQGSVGLEVGVGITVPVGGEGSSIFADFSADINSGYSNINGTVGYRINF